MESLEISSISAFEGHFLGVLTKCRVVAVNMGFMKGVPNSSAATAFPIIDSSNAKHRIHIVKGLEEIIQVSMGLDSNLALNQKGHGFVWGISIPIQ